MSKEINLIFPHQLFAKSPLLENGLPIYLIEEFLFFRQYKFHKQKIAFHRASMKSYEAFLKSKGHVVHYIESHQPISDIRRFIKENQTLDALHIVDPTDNWLEKRLKQFTKKTKIVIHPSPLFLNTKKDNAPFFRTDKKFFFQTTFYKQQRKRLGILLNDDDTPVGDKWSFDAENRKKYPKKKTPPVITFPGRSKFWLEAYAYVHQYFGNNPGSLNEERQYPLDHQESKNGLINFYILDFMILALMKMQLFLKNLSYIIVYFLR